MASEGWHGLPHGVHEEGICSDCDAVRPRLEQKARAAKLIAIAERFGYSPDQVEEACELYTMFMAGWQFSSHEPPFRAWVTVPSLPDAESETRGGLIRNAWLIHEDIAAAKRHEEGK